MIIAAVLICFGLNLKSQSENFDYLDVFDLQMVANPAISPDGELIVYERYHFDIMTDRRYSNLWIISFDGTAHKALSSGKNNLGNVQWSPDGSRIAYVSGEEGPAQIFVRWMDSGQVSSITNLQRPPSNLSWSPDGRFLLFSKNVPTEKSHIGVMPSPPQGAEWARGPEVIERVKYRQDGNPGFVQQEYRHLFVVSAEGGAPRKLSEGNFNHLYPSWAPEGRSIMFTADYSGNEDTDPNNAQIFELDLQSMKLLQITDKRGPHNHPGISPDGRFIFYQGYKDQFMGYQQSQLYVMNRDGSRLRELTSQLDVDVNNPVWSSDSKSIWFRYDQEGVSKVGLIDLDGSFTEVAKNLGAPSIGRPYGGGSFTVADNNRIAFPMISSQRPAELAVSQAVGRMPHVITNINHLLFERLRVGEVEEFWVDSSVDDFRVQGWIIYPPDFAEGQSYPTILEIHGGPYQNYGPRFSPELQLMASRGYVVLYTNPRGSTSYGSDFASYINFNYPSEDYYDLMDAVDYLVERGVADSNNLFITGGSGGGVLTTWAIGKTDRFAAAVASKPVINWHSFALTADLYPFFNKYWFTAMPWEDPEQFLERSPLMLVGNVSTPTMLLTGELDFRTPMSESEQYFNALKLRGVDAALVRFPDTPHNLVLRPSNLIRLVSHITGWFDRYQATED